jgi:hypothetical protein
MNSRPPRAQRTCKVARKSRAIDEALRFAELAVAYCDDESREAATMVVSELAENMLKYGAAGTGLFAGTISITVEGRTLCIKSTNEVAHPDDAQRVEKSIAEIAASPSVATLYRDRLAKLFSNPGIPRAELGLLRAAFEGGVRLSCSFEPPLLHIVAERACVIT